MEKSDEKSDKRVEQKIEMRTWAAIITSLPLPLPQPLYHDIAYPSAASIFHDVASPSASAALKISRCRRCSRFRCLALPHHWFEVASIIFLPTSPTNQISIFLTLHIGLTKHSKWKMNIKPQPPHC